MANYYSGTIQKGSKGDETKKWQEFLNTQGYGLTVDGDFGDKTYNATIDYQTKNGLTVDGIVGKNTWTKAGYTLSPSSQTFEYGDFTYDPFEYADYKESDSVINAGNKKTEAENALASYGDFNYSNQGTFDDIINKILNREKFSYDLNADALYQQYKDKYMQQGKMAMQDTMGQAAAMTGGYGNSYAASVGNQAYQAHLNNLNDVIPELYQMAYDKYNQEGQDLYNQYGLLSDDRNMEYGMWGDKYNKLAADRGYYADVYNSERNYDYNKYADDRGFEYGKYSDDRNLDYNKYSSDKNLAYQQHRDAIADEQWEKTFNEGVRQFNTQQAAVTSGGSGGGSGSGSGGKGSGSGDSGFDTSGILTYAGLDDNGRAVYYDENGKSRTYEVGINPYTGTKNKDCANGTFSNGYQPNNIGGTKLTNSGMSTSVTGKNQTIWEANGKYWVWYGKENKYVEVDIEDID